MMKKKLPAVELVIILALLALVGSLTPRLFHQNLNLAEAISKEDDSAGETYKGVVEKPQDVTKLVTETTEKITEGSKLPTDFAISEDEVKDMTINIKNVLLGDTNWVETTRDTAVSSAKTADAFVDKFIEAFEAYGFDEATAIELTGELFDNNKDLIFNNNDVKKLGITYADASAALDR